MQSVPPVLGTTKHRVLLALALAALLLSMRIIAAMPALGGYITNLDEVEMAWSVLDRLLGVPSTALAWPNSFLQLVSLPPALTVQVILGPYSGLEGLVQNLALGYRTPWQAVFVVRVVVATLFSAATGLWLWLLLRGGASRAGATLLLLLGSSAPALWMSSITAKGEGLALALLLFGFAVPQLQRVTPMMEAVLVGVIAGAAMASRNTLAPVLMPLMLYVCPNKRTVCIWLISVSGAFVLLCPSVWLEPVRLVKSVAGNVMRPSTEGVLDGLRAVLVSSPVAIWGLGLFATCGAFARRLDSAIASRQWRLAGGSLAVIVVLLLVPLCGRQISSAYFVGIPCLLWVVILSQAPHLSCLNARLVPAWLRTRRSLSAILALATVYQFASCTNSASAAVERYQPLHELKSQLLANPRRTLLPRVFLPYFAANVSKATLRQLSTAAAQTMAQGTATELFLTDAGIPPAVASSLRRNFDEDEQAFVARTAVASIVEPDIPLDLGFYDHLQGPSRYGLPVTNDALEALMRGRVELLAVMGQPLEGHTPTATINPGADWGIYLYAAPSAGP
jgi:hypothetical protein